MKLSTVFYRNLSLILLCLNIALLAFFFLARPPHPKGHRAAKVMNFTEQQEVQFRKYADQHKEQVTAYNEQQRSLIERYFSTLKANAPAVNADSLLQIFQTLEKQKVEITYQHFQEIKALLHEEQYADFENFVEQSMNRVLQRSKKRKHKAKD